MNYYQESVALGSKTGISMVSEIAEDEIQIIYKNLWRKIFLFERRFSRFLPGSELSVFNRNAGTKQNISKEFRQLLVAAKEIAIETEGLYNPFILPALQASGYVKSRVPGHETDSVDDHSTKSVVNVENLQIGDDWAQIPYRTAIDLGGSGKGYLADQLKKQIPESVTGYWMSFGGDIAVGGKDDNKHDWQVGIELATSPGQNVGDVSVTKPIGIASSGTTVHRGVNNGKSWHHIIDPRTLKPAVTDVLLASVVDESVMRADVFASCAVILGSDQALKFLKKHKVQAALLQLEQSKVIHYGNAILTGNRHA